MKMGKNGNGGKRERESIQIRLEMNSFQSNENSSELNCVYI